MRTHARLHTALTFFFTIGLLSLSSAAPLGTAITYQGQLILSENPVDEPTDLRFRLFDAASAGTQVGATVDLPSVAVSNGLFTVALDFGAGAFDGDARWLEVEARVPASSGSYVTISPRQALTPAPYALYAKSTAKRVESGTGVTAGDGTLAVTFDTPYASAPAVTATAVSVPGGVIMTLVSVTATGFTAKATVPDATATASSYTHTHTASWGGLHTHCIAAELDHAHPIPIQAAHMHAIVADPAHTHMYNDVTGVVAAAAHTHMYDRISAVLGVTGGAPGSFDIFTGPPEEPCAYVDAYRAWMQGSTVMDWPICAHTHKATIDQVVQHTHMMEMVEYPTSADGGHGHGVTKVGVASGAGGAHAHGGATGADPAHAHGGATGAAGAHAHGGVTCAGDPPLHDHDLSSDTHSHTISVTVGPAPVSVSFCWMAAGN